MSQLSRVSLNSDKISSKNPPSNKATNENTSNKSQFDQYAKNSSDEEQILEDLREDPIFQAIVTNLVKKRNRTFVHNQLEEDRMDQDTIILQTFQ